MVVKDLLGVLGDISSVLGVPELLTHASPCVYRRTAIEVDSSFRLSY